MKRTKDLFWGVFFVLAAVFVIFARVYDIGFHNLFGIIVTLLLVPVIVKSAMYRHFGGVLIPLAVIAWFFAEPLHLTRLTPLPLLGAAILLSIGLSFLFDNHSGAFRSARISYHKDVAKNGNIYNNSFRESSSQESDSIVNIETRFAGNVKYIKSAYLQRVNVYSSFGGTKIFFDDAQIVGDSAVVSIDASFAGIELYVPKTWRINNNVDCTMGGVDEKGIKQESSVSKTLELIGYIRMAGITIIYV